MRENTVSFAERKKEETVKEFVSVRVCSKSSSSSTSTSTTCQAINIQHSNKCKCALWRLSATGKGGPKDPPRMGDQVRTRGTVSGVVASGPSINAEVGRVVTVVFGSFSTTRHCTPLNGVHVQNFAAFGCSGHYFNVLV